MEAMPPEALTSDDVGVLFRDFARPWWIAGGWALDLFLDRQTREHADVEVALFRADQDRLRAHLIGWELRYVQDHRLCDWPADLRLDAPIHELRASRDWARGEFELLLNERVDDEWCFRRDPRIRRPVTDVGIVTSRGIPALAPEIVLLYKAANPRRQDDDDFAAVAPALGDERRDWLASALALAYPGHAWL